MPEPAVVPQQKKYTAEKYWFIMFPILIFAVVGVWICVILFYPYVQDNARAGMVAVNRLTATAAAAAGATARASP
jgi:hypothetical protein